MATGFFAGGGAGEDRPARIPWTPRRPSGSPVLQQLLLDTDPSSCLTTLQPAEASRLPFACRDCGRAANVARSTDCAGLMPQRGRPAFIYSLISHDRALHKHVRGLGVYTEFCIILSHLARHECRPPSTPSLPSSVAAPRRELTCVHYSPLGSEDRSNNRREGLDPTAAVLPVWNTFPPFGTCLVIGLQRAGRRRSPTSTGSGRGRMDRIVSADRHIPRTSRADRMHMNTDRIMSAIIL
jgi:hypothetical protein